MKRLLLVFLTLAPMAGAGAQPPLAEQIRAIAADARGKVSVACSLPGADLHGDLNPAARPPMQSVFKLPLAIAVLHLVESGKLALDQPVRMRKSDLFIPRAYSPLQDQFPQANVDLPLRDLLRRAVSDSDNVAADMLLHLAGGPGRVNDYIASLGVDGFHLVDGEHALHHNPSLQYRNWFEPSGAVQLLRRIDDHSPLNADDNALLFEWMSQATITDRLKGDLPGGTFVAHKTGSSGVVNGRAAATNDIGLITLPNGRHLAVAVFITDSIASDGTRDKVIARISRAIYDAATSAAAGK